MNVKGLITDYFTNRDSVFYLFNFVFIYLLDFYFVRFYLSRFFYSCLLIKKIPAIEIFNYIKSNTNKCFVK